MHMFRNLIVLWFMMLASVSYAGWTPPVRISDEGTSFGPRIVANGDTLHVVYWTSQNRSFYLRTEEGGDNWAGPFDIAFDDDSSSTLSPLVLAAGDTVVVAWRHSFGFANRVNWGIRISTDGGAMWGEILFVLPTHNYELRKYSACSSAGVLYLIYSRWSQGLLFEFTKSTDWGETWTTPTEVFRTQETGRFDMVAVGDTIHFVWVGKFDYDHRWEVYHIRSTDAGVNWSENSVLSTIDDRGSNWPTISINSLGNIAVCWMDYKHSPYLITGDIFIRYSYDGGESWTEEEQLSSHHLVFPVRVLWRGDSIHVVWEDWRNEQPDVYYKYSKDNGATWEDEQRVEDDAGSSEDPDLEIVGDNIHLVWADFGQTSGSGIYYSRWEEEVLIKDEVDNSLPDKPNLVAYPNPFNSSTILTYNGLEGGEIEIYNIVGQKIQTLKTTEKEGKITHTGQVIWDARDALGNKVSSGIYFARAKTGNNYAAIKLLYMK